MKQLAYLMVVLTVVLVMSLPLLAAGESSPSEIAILKALARDARALGRMDAEDYRQVEHLYGKAQGAVYYEEGARAGSKGYTWYWPNGARAGSLGYSWYYPDGTRAGSDGYSWYHANGSRAGSVGYSWYYPNGARAGSIGGSWYYKNGRLAGNLGLTSVPEILEFLASQEDRNG